MKLVPICGMNCGCLKAQDVFRQIRRSRNLRGCLKIKAFAAFSRPKTRDFLQTCVSPPIRQRAESERSSLHANQGSLQSVQHRSERF